MGTLVMFGFVIVVAFAGGIYFVIQDRKETRRHTEQNY